MGINPRLVKQQNVHEMNVRKIEQLHQVKLDISIMMATISNGPIDLRLLDMICDMIEFKLQELWGFPRNKNYHRYWERPWCSCPVSDNEDRYPHGPYIINHDCPLHGKHSNIFNEKTIMTTCKKYIKSYSLEKIIDIPWLE